MKKFNKVKPLANQLEHKKTTQHNTTQSNIILIIRYLLTILIVTLFFISCGVGESTAPSSGLTAFQQDIESATTVPNFATVRSPLTREVLSPLGANAGATLEKRYATENGGGAYDGSTWANAWAAVNLRDNINAISDASANKVYLIMIAGGTYKPDYSNPANREISFSMKNHVAIMGGFQAGGGWARTGTTLMSGDIGTVNDNSDNSYHVFFHNNISLGNSHLYGVTITNGNANSGSVVAYLRGGGMYNSSSSPNLTQVTFSRNTATGGGGGMYNTSGSAPVVNNVVFSGNNANSGGGMYNHGSSPVIKNTIFSGNTARYGGGMYNAFGSSSVIRNTVFSGNIATGDGGGMYSSLSSTVIVGAVFTGNSAGYGGAIVSDIAGYVDNSIPGLRILNTIFSDNTVTSAGVGPDIAMRRDTTRVETITIAGSVLGRCLTTGQPTNAIVGYGGNTTPLSISSHSASLSKDSVNLTGTATLSVNGMDFFYPTIQVGSSAINLGLYVRKSGSGDSATYYYSEDNATWYTGFTTTGNFSGDSVTPPANAEDLSATDITGKARTGRPDAGVNEL